MFRARFLRLSLVVMITIASRGALGADFASLALWYDKPATTWVEALPVGNGRLGAMVFGDPIHETVQLNEDTVWAGSPYRNDNPAAQEALPQIRRLLFDGQWADAQRLARRVMVSTTAHGMPFQTCGELSLTFQGHEQYRDYRRELDLQNAIATTTYRVDDVHFTREVFASFDVNVICIRLTADQPGKVGFALGLKRAAPVKVATIGPDTLVMSGTTSSHEGIKGKVDFQVRAKVIVEGGAINSADSKLEVTNADTATILIAVGTNFENYASLAADPSQHS